MLLIAGSIVLAILNQSITAMISFRWRASWLILIAAQVPNSAYDVATKQYGFIAISLVSIVIAWRAWKNWESDTRLLWPAEGFCHVVSS